MIYRKDEDYQAGFFLYAINCDLSKVEIPGLTMAELRRRLMSDALVAF